MSEGEDMPDGWARGVLGDLVSSLQTGFACGAHNRGGSGVPHLRPMNVNEQGRISLGELKFVPEEEVNRDERWLRKGDVLFNNTNSPELVGKTALYDLDEPRAFSNHMTRIRIREGISATFYAMWLHQKWREQYFEGICNNHVSQASVSRTALAALQVVVPPTNEQFRIVAAVERILGKVASARERLERVPRTVKQFRRAVLAAGCSGRLTADWRTSKNIVDEIGTNEDGLEFPDAWGCKRTAELVETGTVITYGIVLPGPNLSDGVPYIRGMDIDDAGRIHTYQLWRTSPEIAAKHKRAEIKEGDVLLCVIRNLRVAVVPAGLDGANLTQGTVRLRPSSEISSRYLAHYLASPQAQRWMKDKYVGSDMPRINVEHTRIIPVPLPSLREQSEIVQRVDSLFDLADSIEKRASSALQRVESLAQSVLAKAFRGQLVPTEAELARREGRGYEPASHLLARLKNSTNGETKQARAKKSSKQKPAAEENLLEFMEG